MGGDSGEQQKLGNAVRDAEKRTRHEQILSLYHGNSLGQVAVGLWGKVVVEFAIVALPIAAIIIPPGFVLAFFNIGPFSYLFVLSGWVGASTTVFGITWCFTESPAVVNDGSDGEESTEGQE